jgi:UDP-glucuronate decarboxylase
VGPINLGNPEEISMLELARKVIARTGSSSTIVFEPLPVDDPMQRRPDISKARALLGWKPKVSLDEGIDRVVPYFKAKLRESGVVLV